MAVGIGDGPSPVFGTGEATPGVQHVLLGSQVQERSGAPGESLVEGCEDE